MSAADDAITYALAQLGKPYQWGATGPNTFDCSGLTMMAYRAAGITIGRTTYQQILDGSKVALSDVILPGDLVFPDEGHVQLSIGNGRVIEAPHTGANIRIVVASWGGTPIAVRRLTSPGIVVSQFGNDGGSAKTSAAGLGGPTPWTGTPTLALTAGKATVRFQPRPSTTGV